jgi:hypothetical protein
MDIFEMPRLFYHIIFISRFTNLPAGKHLPDPEISGRLSIKIRSCKQRITVRVLFYYATKSREWYWLVSKVFLIFIADIILHDGHDHLPVRFTLNPVTFKERGRIVFG